MVGRGQCGREQLLHGWTTQPARSGRETDDSQVVADDPGHACLGRQLPEEFHAEAAAPSLGHLGMRLAGKGNCRPSKDLPTPVHVGTTPEERPSTGYSAPLDRSRTAIERDFEGDQVL